MQTITPQFLAAQKKRLLVLRDEVIGHASERKAEKNGVAETGDMGDEAKEHSDVAVGVTLLSKNGDALLEIEAALHLIEEKTYGGCLVCDKTIAEARLQAVPQAYLCLPCQQRAERNAPLQHEYRGRLAALFEKVEDEEKEKEE